jgi:hypothetical protein
MFFKRMNDWINYIDGNNNDDDDNNDNNENDNRVSDKLCDS